jgi:SAM-dependent methyltransferase
VRAHDAATRARVARGEDDSLAYLLVFGTSFTRAPRLTASLAETFAATPPGERPAPTLDGLVAQAMNTRLDDLVAGMRRPGGNARLAWARAAVERHGHRLDTPQGRQAARVFLLQNYARVRRESEELAGRLAQAGAAGSRDADLAQRARLFADRGLAPDTSWPINVAIDEALATLSTGGTLAPGAVRRVAVVGPGLDFVDKDEGLDAYPPQTLQPFAVIDALVARRLATPGALQVTALDLSRRIVEHVRAAAGPSARPYLLHLVRDPRVPWTGSARGYFDRFGTAIAMPGLKPRPPSEASAEVRSPGASVRSPGASAPGSPDLEVRSLSVDPILAGRVTAIDINVVSQRLDLPPADRFDLVVATNVLLYYDVFAQALAASNLAHLLAPGGLLLTNTRLDDLPALPLRRVQETATAFSTRPGDGEYVFVYGLR